MVDTAESGAFVNVCLRAVADLANWGPKACRAHLIQSLKENGEKICNDCMVDRQVKLIG